MALVEAQQTQPAPKSAQPAPKTAQPAPSRPATPTGSAAPTASTTPTGPTVQVPNDYVIGPEDVIGVLFWREPDMSGDATVRPDGMVTLPLLGDVRAAGLRPEALGISLEKAASKYLTDTPKATVVVRQVNSRKVFILGEVRQPGAYPILQPRNVMQLLALAGGVNEYADTENISVMRQMPNGPDRIFKFNYKDVLKGRRPEQNIQLQPGDTVTVP